MMRRRDFITLISGATAAWPLAARAQQKIPQVGVLLVEGPELMGPYREALRALGYIEGKTIEIEVRSAQGQGRPPSRAGGGIGPQQGRRHRGRADAGRHRGAACDQ
jgi:hypothetical protein